MTSASSTPSEARMHAAIAARDAAHDSAFCYGVVTTGVFCRPSCPSRPPRPENVRFFAGPAAALAAGFRPCRRCRPADDSSALEPLVAVARHLARHADQRITLAALACRAGMSVSTLQRSFKAAFGVSPRVYQQGLRMKTFKTALQGGEPVTAALHAAGFGSTSRVYDNPAHHLGMTPSRYRAGGAGELICYAARATALGVVLMGATGRGICFAEFGESEAALMARLRTEFPRAGLQPSPAATAAAAAAPALDAWVDSLVAYLSGGGPRPELPLDLRGTAFQMRVWRFLLGLPHGHVVSYGEVAAAIDQPRAVRAVASACAANRVAVLVPCHRVLRGDGGLGGYRWGVERKRTLLDAERRAGGRS